MTDKELLAQLVRLAGDLFGDGADEELYRVLVRAIRRGQPVELIAPASTAPRPWPRPETIIDNAKLALFRSVIAEPDDPARPTPLVLRRTNQLPPRIAPDAWPAWTRGRRRKRTLGPLREATTRRVWFDIWEDPLPFIIYRAAGQGPTAEPVVVLAGEPETSTATVILGSGDAWINATVLDPAAPPDSWIALAADRVSIESDIPPVIVNQDRAVFAQQSRLTLRSIPREGGPLGSNMGEAGTTHFDLRGDLTIAFSPGDASVLYDGADLETLGIMVRLIPTGQAPRYDAATGYLLVQSSIDGDNQSITERLSGPWKVRGRASISEAALAFALCRLSGPPTVLGAVDGGPIAWLKLDDGLTLEVQSVRDDADQMESIAVGRGRLLARTGELWIAAEPAQPLTGVQRLRPGWHAGDGPASARSEFVIAHSGLKSLETWSNARPGNEPGTGIVRRGERFRAALARPALADGTVLTLEGECDIVEQTTGQLGELSLHAVRLGLTDARPIAFALSNGLLRARKVSQLTLQTVRPDAEGSLTSGWLTLGVQVDLAVPMLADPYASDFLPWDDGGEVGRPAEILNVVTAADWRDEGASAELAFGLLDYRADPLAGDPAPREEPPDHDTRRRIDQHHRPGFTEQAERRRLLDVSGAADHLGLALYAAARSDERVRRASALDLDGLAFTHSLDRTDLLLLPGFLNERVGNIPNPNVLPFPAMLSPLGDGGPQRLSVEFEREVPLDTRRVGQALVTAIDASPLRGLVSLPFGIRASIVLDRMTEEGAFEPVEVDAGDRGNLRGAEQWRLHCGPQAGGTSAVLPGFAHQMKLGRGSDGITRSVLGDDVETFFNDSFSELSTAPGQTPRAPISSIDLSGRGNSLVSLWRNPGLDQEVAPTSGVSEVRFTALVGRTSLEVVQITSLCHPWCARFVRTVTIRRSSSGSVWRSDSGWQAAGDARFAYEGLPEEPETGAIRRLTAITNIRETAVLVEHPSMMQLRSVHFDALAEIEGAETLVPVRDVEGWVEARPAPEPRPQALTGNLLKFVLQPEAGTSRGGCFGHLDTKVRVADSEQEFHATSLGIELGSPAPLLVGVLRGNLVMPERGSWTVACRKAGEAAYKRLAAGDTVPLTARAATSHLREARDLMAPAPAIDYALLHSSDSHRFLMPDPRFAEGSERMEGGRPALFADQFALARAETIMPADIDCVPMPPGTRFAILRSGHLALEVPGTTVEVSAPAGAPWRQLVLEQTGSDNQLRLEYRGVDHRPAILRLEIDTRAPDGREWSYEIGNVCITSDLEPFGRFSTASGAIKASSDAALRFDNLKVQFSDALETAQSFMDIIQTFSFPPLRSGGATVRASDYAKAEKVHYSPIYIGREIDVPILEKPPAPHEDDDHDIDAVKKDWVDIGCGKFMGNIGFFLRIGQLQKSQHHKPGAFTGVKFEVSGRLVAPVIWPLYAGGVFKIEYEWKAPGMPDPGHFVAPEEEEHKLEVSAGGTGLMSLDLKAFEAELSVSYVHVLSFEGVKNPFDKVKYGLKYILEGEVGVLKVEPLGSAVGLSFGFESMVIPSRARNEAGEYTDQVSFHIKSAVVLEATAAWVFQAEFEVEAEAEFKAGLPTLAAFVLANPYFAAGELM